MDIQSAVNNMKAMKQRRKSKHQPIVMPKAQTGLGSFMNDVVKKKDNNALIEKDRLEKVAFNKEMAAINGLGNAQNIRNNNQGFNELGAKVGYLPGSSKNFIGENNSSKSKASRNNNPGNITGMGGKLLYGASSIAKSKTGDKGDRAQLVFNTPQEGWNAMRSLMSSERYNSAPIRQAFQQYQTDQNAYANILKEYQKKGIDVDRQTFNSLTPELQNEFMKTRARFEGYKGVGPSFR